MSTLQGKAIEKDVEYARTINVFKSTYTNLCIEDDKSKFNRAYSPSHDTCVYITILHY